MVQAVSWVSSSTHYEVAEISDHLPDILKYEYMTQLLLDANYLPLILKLFAHQDIDKAVNQKNDREDLEYAQPLALRFC